VHTDCKLQFHRREDFLFPHSVKLLELIRAITFSFSALDALLMIHFAFVSSKLKYASVAWNSVTVTDSNQLERV
jgi:hypothetical protein